MKKWRVFPKKHEKVKILLGHSAYHFLNHKFYLQKFARFKEQIEFYIPLSYGNKTYAAEVEKLAYQIYPKENLKIFKEILKIEDYFKILSEIDLAIFDYKHQSAVGNIMLLLYLQKHVFLNPNGILFKGFKADGLDVFSVGDLDKINFNKILNSSINKYNSEYVERAISYNTFVNNWLKLFNDLGKDFNGG